MALMLPQFADDHDRRWFERFCREVWIQCDYGLYAWADVKRGQGWGGSAARVFPAIHSMLTAAGTLCFLLDKASARGQRLSTAFGDPAIATIRSRAARNSLEHIDERLDTCATMESAGSVRYAFDHDICNWEVLSQSTAALPIRHLDNTTWLYRVIGRDGRTIEVVDLKALSAEFLELHTDARGLVKMMTGSDLPPAPAE